MKTCKALIFLCLNLYSISSLGVLTLAEDQLSLLNNTSCEQIAFAKAIVNYAVPMVIASQANLLKTCTQAITTNLTKISNILCPLAIRVLKTPANITSVINHFKKNRHSTSCSAKESLENRFGKEVIESIFDGKNESAKIHEFQRCETQEIFHAIGLDDFATKTKIVEKLSKKLLSKEEIFKLVYSEIENYSKDLKDPDMKDFMLLKMDEILICLMIDKRVDAPEYSRKIGSNSFNCL